MAPFGKANTIKKTFSRTTTIQQSIQAAPADIFALLTDVSGYPNWNSTIVSLEGELKSGGKIKLVSTLDPKRTFKLNVKEVIPNQKLVWGDGMGERVYLLEAEGKNTLFTMTEKIGGFMFPLFARMIPAFDESFEQFTTDLKQAAESK